MELIILKGPLDPRGQGLRGCPAHPLSHQSGPRPALPGSHSRGLWTQRPPPTGDSERDGRGQGIGQAGGQGPIAFLWKGSSASSGDRPGWHGSGREPMRRVGGGWGKGALGSSPSSWVLLPRCAELREGSQEEACGWSRSQDTVAVPGLDPVLRAAPGLSPSMPQKRERPHHWQLSLMERINSRQAEGSSAPGEAWGPPSPRSKPRSQSVPAACSL